MKMTINIDDKLLNEAQKVTGIAEKTALVSEGLRALVERENAHQLAQLGGTEPQLRTVRRRQSKTANSTPAGKTWDDWFSASGVSDDFMETR